MLFNGAKEGEHKNKHETHQCGWALITLQPSSPRHPRGGVRWSRAARGDVPLSIPPEELTLSWNECEENTDGWYYSGTRFMPWLADSSTEHLNVSSQNPLALTCCYKLHTSHISTSSAGIHTDYQYWRSVRCFNTELGEILDRPSHTDIFNDPRFAAIQ